MMDVVGIYRGRTYVARLTGRGVWVVAADGPVFVFPALDGEPADAIRREIERLFQALPELGPDLQRRDTGRLETYQGRPASPS